jgi:hypothetical protein
MVGPIWAIQKALDSGCRSSLGPGLQPSLPGLLSPSVKWDSALHPECLPEPRCPGAKTTPGLGMWTEDMLARCAQRRGQTWGNKPKSTSGTRLSPAVCYPHVGGWPIIPVWLPGLPADSDKTGAPGGTDMSVGS